MTVKFQYTSKIAKDLNLRLIASNKVRDENGEPQITVAGDVTDEICLIVDDLADGGRTFVKLANALKALGARKVYLYVTHGMFHYGFDELVGPLDGIYTTDSYRVIETSEYPEGFVIQMKVSK